VAFVATHFAAMAGMAMWVALEWKFQGKPTTLGAASGAIAGLATITPTAGFVGPNAAVLVGLIGGTLCYTFVSMKMRFRLDDSLDVVGIHGVGGLVGTICLGLFASTAVNPGGVDGLFHGNPGQLFSQIIGAVVVGVYAFAVSWIIFKLIDASVGLRLSDEAEVAGLDSSEHSETAYN
jgi:Amt family ammonium transporter